MAVKGESWRTLSERLKQTGPDKKIGRIMELLNQKNAILDDAITLEGNLPTGHMSVQRSGLPTGRFRRYNEGIDAEKSQSKSVTDATGMLDALSKVDVEIAKLNGDQAAYRAKESMAFASGMGITAALNMFYANSKIDDEKFMGIAPRFNEIGDDSALASYNVIDGGGDQNANSSFYMITWGDETAHMIYPKGSKAGLEHEDMGTQLVKDANGKEFRAFVDYWSWKLGFAMPDWRYSGRLANIDVPSLKTIGDGDNDVSKNLEMQLIDLTERRPDDSSGQTVLYCNKLVRAALRKKALSKNNTLFRMDDFGGKPMLMFDDIPIRICDGILTNEQNVPVAA